MSIHGTFKLRLFVIGIGSRHYLMKQMSFSITWVLLVRMDGILSAEHFKCCVQIATILLSLQILHCYNTGGAWLDTWHMYHDRH